MFLICAENSVDNTGIF